MHAQHQAPFPMPYGFYPQNPFFANPVQWSGASFLQPPWPGPQANQTAPLKQVCGPNISEWLWNCDQVPGCGGFFLGLADKFVKEGYHTIDQLTNHRMTVENLSNWLEIEKGTADLIIQYAKEDMESVRDGKFMMELVHGGDGEDMY